jgi:hypothetical protein
LVKLRDQAAAEIERLLTFLDETDDLDEREDVADDEPSLGFSEPLLTGDEMPGFTWPYTSRDAAQHPTPATPLCTMVLECEHDGAEPDDDSEHEEDEPSLGSVASIHMGGSQKHWAAGSALDLEDDGDDLEPSLCGINAGSANLADGRDLEEGCEDEGVLDSGIADTDGLMEQIVAIDGRLWQQRICDLRRIAAGEGMYVGTYPLYRLRRGESSSPNGFSTPVLIR